MKRFYNRLVFIFLIATNTSALAQITSNYCLAAPRYDTEVFSTVDTSLNIVFGANSNYQNVNTVLKMDIYQPSGDTASIRPLIVFAHGGSFIGGDKSNSDQVDLCTHFAKRGYVTATINYRLGISFPFDSTNATRAVYRAVQDMKAAIRYFRKDAATTNLYHIDPNVIFIGGSSAGALTALHYAYLDQYNELPVAIDTAVMGNIEGNSGNAGYSTAVNAVINLCGALGKKTWMQPGDEPLVSMHGTADNVVPYNTQMLNLLTVFPILVVDGSYSINRYADSIGVTNAMYTYFGAPHVPYDGGTLAQQAYLDTTVRFVSNFLYSYLGCTPIDPNPLPNTFNTTNSIVEQNDIDELLIYPNPVHQDLTIQLKSIPTAVILRNLTGKEIYRCEKQLSNTSTIPLHQFAKGMYLLEVITKDKTLVEKVIIE